MSTVRRLITSEEYDAVVRQRDEWRSLYAEVCDKLAAATAPPVCYQPCEKHRGMSMMFTATSQTVAAIVCPGCNPPPHLVCAPNFHGVGIDTEGNT